jgi:hypothetical protein
MKTPAGHECRFYYEDFHRGRSKQECRLIKGASHSPAWQSSDCERCQVPRILLDNASPHLVLEGKVKLGFLGLGRRVDVTAYCSKHNRKLEDPHVGCPICADEFPNPLKDLLE